MTDQRGTSLTRREFDAVIRRAAELASTDSSEGELSETELYRIASDVGLSETHVRRALSEVRSGSASGGLLDRIFGPVFIRVVRDIPGTSAELAEELDRFFLGTQILQVIRRGPRMLQYRPALDWASQLARAASFSSRKYYVASAHSVEVHLDEAEGGKTRVEIVVDPGTRPDAIAGATVGGIPMGLVAGALTGFGTAALLPVLPVAIGIGVVVGGGTIGGITRVSGSMHKKKLRAVQTEIEGLLDTLEMGETLEPPPPSWRRWVKRHFHGVARDLMGEDERSGRGTRS